MMTAFVRTIILYFFIMAGMRLMGKRQIGELEPSELVLTMMISDLAAVPMQDFGIPLLFGLVPILTLLALSLLLSQLSLRSIRFRALVCGTPTVLIQNGKLLQDAMRRNRYTVDELLEEEDDVTLPTVLINDGRVIRRNLAACGRDGNWLRRQLSREKIASPEEVFLLTVDEQGSVLCVRKEETP